MCTVGVQKPDHTLDIVLPLNDQQIAYKQCIVATNHSFARFLLVFKTAKDSEVSRVTDKVQKMPLDESG